MEPESPRDPSAPGAHSIPAACGDPAPARRIFVARQPIFDRDSRVVAYELLFRNSSENRFTVTDTDAATAISIEQSTAAFGFDDLVGNALAFVNLSRGALHDELYRLLPRERTVVELLESLEPTADNLLAVSKLHDAGYVIALDDYVGGPNTDAFLPYAAIVKVDVRTAPHWREGGFVAALRAHGLRPLAEKVETHEEHAAALEAGYELFQGYFFCEPQMLETRDLPPSKAFQLRFLSEASRTDASFERLEELFRQDVALTMRLLRYLNSAAFGWRYEITSLRHALALMGLRPLRKWALMMGLLSLASDRPRALVVTSLARARFAERLGAESGLDEHDLELFLTGMLSVADAMVGRPLEEILSGLAVPESVRDALLGGDNEVGAVLRMVRAYERGDWATLDDARGEGGPDDAALDAAYVQSLEWAEATADA